MPPGTYTGKITEANTIHFPRRRRPLVRGRIRGDSRFKVHFFEIYADPTDPLRKHDRVQFELDEQGNPINIRRLRFA